MPRLPMKKTTLWLLVLLVCLVALDQVTKWYIVLHFALPGNGYMEAVEAFRSSVLNLDIVRLHNTGVAFGMGNGTVWAPFVFLGVQVVALVGLVWLYARGFFSTRLLKVAWACVLAGVLGNMADRLTQGFFLPGVEGLGFFEKLRLGYVVDFIDFSLPWLRTASFPLGYHWPAFNVADSCVCIAAGLFIISAFFFPEPEPAAS